MENPLKSLIIKNYHSYLLVLSGTILIISLFYESKIISQSKLVILCLITILYGIIEWIREFQFKDKLRRLNIEWDLFWDAQPLKSIAQINDPSYNLNLIKKFKEEHNADKLNPRYHLKTWIIFVIYLALMILTYLK